MRCLPLTRAPPRSRSSQFEKERHSTEKVERVAAEEARALRDISLAGRLDLSLGDSAVFKATRQPPMPCMPSFGLGLMRQRAFAPASVLTEVELAARHEEHGRCAAALGRLVRRSNHARMHRRVTWSDPVAEASDRS